jgi:hypothetical protein
MGDVPLIDADRFLQCGPPANIPEAALRERLLPAARAESGRTAGQAGLDFQCVRRYVVGTKIPCEVWVAL